MRQEGRSWWLSLDRDYMADSGCLGRLVILGRAFEVYRPMKEQGITSAGPAQ
jgi:hypothetical protein